MSAKFNIRDFKSEDVPSLIKVWNASLTRDPITDSRFISWLLGDPNHYPYLSTSASAASQSAPTGLFVATLAATGEVAGFIRATLRRVPNETLGLEPEYGYIPVVAVAPEHQRQGAGTLLLAAAMEFLLSQGATRVYVCGKTGSAPGYVFPGVDTDNYKGGLRLFEKAGFVADHPAVGMLGVLNMMDVPAMRRRVDADERCRDVVVRRLRMEEVYDFLDFLRVEFPGDWNTAARGKVACGRIDEIMVALLAGKIVGYCQWEGEHFGPFGVAHELRNKGIGAKVNYFIFTFHILFSFHIPIYILFHILFKFTF